MKLTWNLKYIIYGIINYIIFFHLYNSLKFTYGIKFRIIFPFIYFIFTYVSYVVLKLINKDDFNIFKSIVDLKSMKKYIKSEIKK